MCTLLTVSSEFFSRALEQRILDDAQHNPDGFSLLLTAEEGTHTLIRTMDVSLVLSVLRSASWDRMFLHSRFATQGSVGLENTHGWENDGVFYFHNGCLSAPESIGLPVDSQAIGLWLNEGGIEHAMERLALEPFANVFMVDTQTGFYTICRSTSGSLHTDGQGNFSTAAFGTIAMPVAPGAQEFQFCEVYGISLPEAFETTLKHVWDIDTVDALRAYNLNDTWDIRDDGIDDYISPSLRRRA